MVVLVNFWIALWGCKVFQKYFGLLVLCWLVISSLTITLGFAALKIFCVKWFILWFLLKIKSYQRQVYKFVKTYKVYNALVPQLRSAAKACNPLSREKRPSSIFTFKSSSFPISCSIGLPWDIVNIQLELQALFVYIRPWI